MKRKIFVGILLGLCLLASGCWDRRELDELSFVAGMGAELVEDTKVFELVLQIMIPSAIKSSGQSSISQKDKAYFLVTSKTKTPLNALKLANLQNSRRLNLSHNMVIIIGPTLATQGFAPYFDFFLRNTQMRPTQWVFVTDKKVKEIFDINPKLDKIPASAFKGLMENSDVDYEIEPINIKTIANVLLSKTRAATIPILTKVGPGELGLEEVALDGMAVFKGDRWIGKLSLAETRGMMWVNNKVSGGALPVKLTDDDYVCLDIIRSSTKVKPRLKEEQLEVGIEVNVILNLVAQVTAKDYSSVDGLKYLQNQAKKAIATEIEQTLNKARKMRADVYGFGDAFYRKYPRQWKSMETNWEQLFPEIKVKLKINPKIRMLGKTIKSLDFMNSKGD